MEYVGGGSLFKIIAHNEDGGLPEAWVRFYIAEILLGLEALHQHHIIFRDLKLENVLIDSDGAPHAE